MDADAEELTQRELRRREHGATVMLAARCAALCLTVLDRFAALAEMDRLPEVQNMIGRLLDAHAGDIDLEIGEARALADRCDALRLSLYEEPPRPGPVQVSGRGLILGLLGIGETAGPVAAPADKTSPSIADEVWETVADHALEATSCALEAYCTGEIDRAILGARQVEDLLADLSALGFDWAADELALEAGRQLEAACFGDRLEYRTAAARGREWIQSVVVVLGNQLAERLWSDIATRPPF